MSALGVIDDWDVPNASAAVFDGETVRDDRGATGERFPLASVSKVIAAIAVHIAVEEGSIGLDDAAGPEGSTVLHLLAHASGLGPDGKVLQPPERGRIYSNAGFEVLGDQVADAAGMSFTEYAGLALVEPLGMGATDVSGSPAHGYSSSVDDLCLLLRSLVQNDILASETIAAMTSPAFPDLAGVLPGYGKHDPNPWGLGVEIRGEKRPHWTAPANSNRTWGHFGQSGTFVWFDPEAGIGLVVLTDRDFGQWAIDAWPALSTSVLEDHR